jgi:hypothetical protein
MRLTRQALRQDWPTSARVKTIILETLVDFLVRRRARGEPKADRNVIMAARTLAAFSQLTLQQAELDLKREKLEGKTSDTSLADLVAEAEARAEARRNGRDET